MKRPISLEFLNLEFGVTKVAIYPLKNLILFYYTSPHTFLIIFALSPEHTMIMN